MSAELAATPSNFDSFLSTADAPTDTGSDSGPQDFQDSTGPSNTNNWKGDISNAALQPEGQHVDPERRVMDDEEGRTDFANEFDGEQQPEQEEQPEGEQQTPEGMPPYEQLQEMFQVTQAPELHEYFLDKLVPVNVNGVRVMKTVRETTEGFMRMSDYSRGKQEVTQMGRAAQEAMNQTRGFLQRLQDPQAFRATIKRLGPQWEQSFHKAAEAYAQEKLQYLQMGPEQRAVFDAENRARAIEERAAQMEAELQRRQEQQNSPAEQYRPHIEQTLQAYVPNAWQRHNIPDNQLSQGVFAQHMQSIWNRTMEGIPEAVERASIATAEHLQDLVRRYGGMPEMPQQPQQQQRPAQQPQQQMQRPQAPPQPLPPRRVPGGPVARPANSNGGGDARYRGSNFDEYLKHLGRR
jgi:hypothetical protein